MIEPRIYPLGESAVIVDFGSEISYEVNRRVIQLTDHLNSHPFPGLLEAVPAYSSAAIYFDLATVAWNAPAGTSASGIVADHVTRAMSAAPENEAHTGDLIEIPSSFASEDGIDLQTVALDRGLTSDEVIDIFISGTYRVFMVGFLPGFAYMGSIDQRIRVPRRSEPRTRVPKGSIAIAGEQCGVYPLETPGGWNIVGRTEVEFFRPHHQQPSLLKPGDTVRFVLA